MMRRLQYIGGKQKSGGAQIAAAMNALVRRRGLRTIVEPFCGGLSVTYRLAAQRRVASDACPALVTLYQKMRDGWHPPDLVTREQWEALRLVQDPADPMTAFVGFGCSRSGSWFSSFIECNRRNYVNIPAALAARESLENKLRRCADVEFVACDYRDAPVGDAYYCDPPYEGTLVYAAVREPFDHAAFWTWARTTSETKPLAVSERAAPTDFVPLLTFSLQNRLVTRAEDVRRVEHLFVHASQLGGWT